MKTLKLLVTFIFLALITCNMISGQPYHVRVVVTINGLDYGPGIGVVTGTFTYQWTLWLSAEGYLKSMHWNVIDNDLSNQDGDKVKTIDSGHDNLGIMWDIFNNPGVYNTGYPIIYSVQDGWMDGIMPSELPLEGTFSNMSCKVICKGTKYSLAGLMQLHMNANGDVTANVVKGWLE